MNANNHPNGESAFMQVKAETGKRSNGRRLRKNDRNARGISICGVKKQLPVLGAVVVLLLAVILFVKGCSGSKDSFEGTWNLDGTTMYQFNGSGKGAMILPSNSYEFIYTVDEENATIYIDFADEKVKDYTYTFELSDSELILSGGDEDETFAYEFSKLGS